MEPRYEDVEDVVIDENGKITRRVAKGLHGDRLDDWIRAVDADDRPDLRSFTHGIKRDYDA